jgi:ferredoxin
LRLCGKVAAHANSLPLQVARDKHIDKQLTESYARTWSNEEKDMRIVVDLNRCQGYAQCVPLAPTVLKLNGEEALMYDPNPDDSLRQQVLRAAASCPVQAIIVDRLDEKEDKA